MNWIKIFLANLVNTMALLFLLLISPPIIYKIYMESKSSDHEVSQYDDINLSEVRKLKTEYKDFIVWRRKDHRSQDINITNGVRFTPKEYDEEKTAIWFFGGSTTWGYGVSDKETYPYYVGKRLKYKVENFGETGYVARQSLAYLNNLFINQDYEIPEKIVFYDGVNDVTHRCRSEINGLATDREFYINNKVQDVQVLGTSKHIFSFQSTFNQLIKFTELVSNKIFLSRQEREKLYASDLFNCVSDKDKADYIARTLVSTWTAAKDLANSNGAQFLAVLQPHAYTNKYAMNDDNLNLDSDKMIAVSLQFPAVYPLIKKYAQQAEIEFIDASAFLDNCSDCYFDFCHLRPSGNEKIATFIAQNLSANTF